MTKKKTINMYWIIPFWKQPTTFCSRFFSDKFNISKNLKISTVFLCFQDGFAPPDEVEGVPGEEDEY